MDTVADISILWSKGYYGTPLIYLDVGIYCYVNNNDIILSDNMLPFHFPGAGISAITAHKKEKLIAIADKCLNPSIYIYNFPQFEFVSELKGGAKLEFQALLFFTNNYLVSISGVPDYVLNLWLYEEGVKLCTVSLPSTDITSVSVNPRNWQNLCVTYTDIIHIYRIMKSHNYFEMEEKHIACPPKYILEIPTPPKKESLEQSALEIPLPAIACIVGPEAQNLYQKLEDIPRVCPVSQCWNAAGVLFIGCDDGQILKISQDVSEVQVIFNPELSITDATEPKARAELDGKWMNSLDFILFYRNYLFTAGKNGYLCVFDVANDNDIKLKTFFNTELSIKTATFTFAFDKILIGTAEGKIQTHDINKLKRVTVLKNETDSEFVDLKPIYPGTTAAVSARKNGLIEFWDILDGEKFSSLELKCQVSSLASSPCSSIVVIGCYVGKLCMLDVTKIETPHIVYQKPLCSYSVTCLHFDSQSQYLFALTNHKILFILDASSFTRYKIYGFVEFPNHILSITSENSDGVKIYISLISDNINTGMPLFNKITFLYLEPNFKKTYDQKYQSMVYSFDNEKLHINILLLTTRAMGLEAINGSVYITLNKSHEFLELIYSFDPNSQSNSWQLGKKHFYKQSFLYSMCSSMDAKWMVAAAEDGAIYVFLTNDLGKVQMQSVIHDYHMKAVKSMSLSWDFQFLLITGNDGTISSYTMNIEQRYYIKQQCLITRESHITSLKQKHGFAKRESKACNKLPPIKFQSLHFKSDPLPEERHKQNTWLDVRKQLALAEKEKDISEEKEKIKASIVKIRETVQGMLKINDSRPDIEKLEQYEFDLDVEEQVRLHVDGEAAIQKIYENTEYENLAKLYVKEKIKEECYDKMFVKGRCIKAFLIPLEIDNFPLMKRSREELEQLRKVEFKRKTEKKVAQFNQEILEILSKASGSQSMDIIGSLDSVQDEVMVTDVKIEEGTTTAIEGSFGSSYGGDCEYLYNQLELHSRDQKIAQMILLQDVIYNIKTAFNKEFDDLYSRKGAEISKIREKNNRVSVIMADLGLDEEVITPEFSVAEKPELTFVVNDSEVTVEKYQTTEEIKAREEAKRLKEECQKKEKADNSHERAIQDMMGGVLEIRKEDELKKEIPIPTVGPDEEEWTDEEVKIMKEYERKVKELNDEREKYRKGLENELKKLRGSIQEIMVSFDEVVNNLFQKHIKVLMAIYQEELKLNRIKLNLLVEDEYSIYEKQLLLERDCKRKEMENILQSVQDSEKRNVDYRVKYEQILLEDRQLEKSFRNDFFGISVVLLEILHKHFRKRPKAYKFKTPETLPSGEIAMQSIYAHRKIVLTQLANTSLTAALQELDNESNQPEGVDQQTWAKLCHIRKNKINKEAHVMKAVLTFAELGDFHQYKLEQLEKAHTDLDDIETRLKKLKIEKQQFQIDIDIQLLIKQGQEELEHDALIHDYQGAVLIHRSIIEELNAKIKDLGEQKIASMVESKNFKKQIFHKEWEHRKMMMMMEDLKQKMNIVKFMKVTREIQRYLELENYSAYNSQQTERLEKLLVGVRSIHEKKHMKIEDDIYKLKTTIKMKKKDNERLTKQIKYINVQVNDRRHIADVCHDSPSTSSRVKYYSICHRKKLVNKAKKQAAELTILRKEIERLRRKTFPALI